MVTVTETEFTGRPCAVCDAIAPHGELCPIHRTEAEEFTRNLTGILPYEKVRTSVLSIDQRFQRPPHDDLIRRITMQFSPLALGVLTVSRRKNEHIVLDGQQRLRSLLKMNYVEAPCLVAEGLTYQQEVMVFVILNEQRVAVRHGVLFRAKAEAGVDSYVEARNILRTFGYQLVDPGGRRLMAPNQLSCPATVEKVHSMGHLAKVLTVMRSSWPNQREANRQEVLLGLSAFVEIHGHIPLQDVIDSLGRFQAAELVQQAEHTSKASSERRRWVHFFDAATEKYNWKKTIRVPRMYVPPGAPNCWIRRAA